MRTCFLAVAVFACVSGPVSAEENNPFKWPIQHRSTAATVSDILVWTQLGADFVGVVLAEDQGKAFKCHALRMGLTGLGVMSTKRWLPRLRPDASDDDSFFSGHTAFAAAASGWNLSFGVPIAASTGYLRVAANKHFWSDVVAGAAVGAASARLCAAFGWSR